MNNTDRLWLMVKMLRDNYEKELFSQRKKQKINQNCFLTGELSQSEFEAKKAVCEIGISMYEFSKRLRVVYDKGIETEAIHETVELGISNKLLSWSKPRRYDVEKGAIGQNIVLSEEGFKAIHEEGIQRVIAITHSSYLPKFRG